MKSLRTRIYRGLFAFAVVGALGFGAKEAFAAPSPDPDVVAGDCSECARQCGTILICNPGYCQCA
jgi:hypothetical protein